MLPFINPPPLFKLHSILAEGLPNYLPGQVPNSFFQDVYAKPSSPHMPNDMDEETMSDHIVLR